jgi:hypothetical protein
MTAGVGGRRAAWAVRGPLLLCAAAILVALGAAVPSADAARVATKSERGELLRAAAGSAAGEIVGLRTGRGGRVTIAPRTLTTPATVAAWRSSVAPGWALLDAMPKGDPSGRETFVLRRSGGRWRVRFAAGRGELLDETCRHAKPATPVALDLGLRTSSRRCRHPREPRALQRKMSAQEVASVRRMVEWTYDASFQYMPGPVQPRAHDVFASDCAWDGRGDRVPPPSGVVARSDPRWGLLSVACAIGSDGFAILESTTVMLVSRSGRSGPFTAVHAHTLPSWSSRGTLCGEDRRWPAAAATRVALEFCTPFPYALRDVLR